MQLSDELLRLMERSQADWTLTWRQLALVAEATATAVVPCGSLGWVGIFRHNGVDMLTDIFFWGGAEYLRLAMVWSLCPGLLDTYWEMKDSSVSGIRTV